MRLVKASLKRYPPACEPGCGPDKNGVAVYVLADGTVYYDGLHFYLKLDGETEYKKLEE